MATQVAHLIFNRTGSLPYNSGTGWPGGALSATMGSFSAASLVAANAGQSGDGADCVQFTTTGKNRSPTDYSQWAGTWEDLGVPAGTVVTAVQVTWWWRCSTYTTGAASSVGNNSGDGLYDTTGTIRATNTVLGAQYSGTTAWASRAESTLAVPADLQASGTTIWLRWYAFPYTGSSTSANNTLQQDYWVITVTYDPDISISAPCPVAAASAPVPGPQVTAAVPCPAAAANAPGLGGAPAAYSILQSAGSGSVTGNPSATVGTALSAGTKLVAIVGLNAAFGYDSRIPAAVRDAASNAFTCIANSPAGVVLGHYPPSVSLWVLDTPAGDVGITPAVTATMPAETNQAALIIQEVSGLAAGTSVIDGTPGTALQASAASVPQPAYSSGAADELLYSLAAEDGTGSTVVNAGYALDPNGVQGGFGVQFQAGSKHSTDGAETGTWTGDSPTNYIAMLVLALQAAGGPGLIPLVAATAGDASAGAAAPDPAVSVVEGGGTTVSAPCAIAAAAAGPVTGTTAAQAPAPAAAALVPAAAAGVTARPPAAAAQATAPQASTSSTYGGTAYAGEVSATASAPAVAPVQGPLPATSSAAPIPAGRVSAAVSATTASAAVPVPAVGLSARPPALSAAAAAYAPTARVAVQAPCAAAAATAPDPIASTPGAASPPCATATALAPQPASGRAAAPVASTAAPAVLPRPSACPPVPAAATSAPVPSVAGGASAAAPCPSAAASAPGPAVRVDRFAPAGLAAVTAAALAATARARAAAQLAAVIAAAPDVAVPPQFADVFAGVSAAEPVSRWAAAPPRGAPYAAGEPRSRWAPGDAHG